MAGIADVIHGAEHLSTEEKEAASFANPSERIDGAALFLKWASGSAFPKEGFIRYAVRNYQDVKINPSSPTDIEFVQREDGGFSEQIYESAWQGENFYWKENHGFLCPFFNRFLLREK